MKNSRFSKNGRTSLQLMQPLESRRLMSLTAGYEAAVSHPPMSHDMENHVFAFAVATPSADPSAGVPQLPLSGPADFTASPDPGWLEAHFAHAIAQGSDAVVSQALQTATTAPATPTTPVTSTATISALYSTLSNSTVAEIDNAMSKSQMAVVSDSVPDQMQSSSAAPQLPAGANIQIPATQSLSTVTNTDITLNKAAALTLSIVTNVSELNLVSTAANEIAPPTWATLHTLEEELVAVKSYAQDVILEIGRDSAIALAHFESAIGSELASNIEPGLWTNWCSAAAVGGAAMATIAITQSKTDRDKKKTQSTFSSRLISLGCGFD